DGLGRARQLIQIISYEELSGADRSRMRFYDMWRRAAQEIPHQRIICNLDHVNWLRQYLSFWNTCDAFQLYGHVPTPNRALTAFGLIDNHTVVFAQNWGKGKNNHLDGKDRAGPLRFSFERATGDSGLPQPRGARARDPRET